MRNAGFCNLNLKAIQFKVGGVFKQIAKFVNVSRRDIKRSEAPMDPAQARKPPVPPKRIPHRLKNVARVRHKNLLY